MTDPDPLVRADKYDEWLREGGNEDIADLICDLVQEVRDLRAGVEHERHEKETVADASKALVEWHRRRFAELEAYRAAQTAALRELVETWRAAAIHVFELAASGRYNVDESNRLRECAATRKACADALDRLSVSPALPERVL